MAYHSLSVKDLIKDINDGKYYLPAIQRKFVWGEGKICNLFDSIMKDYPIGTFLFWDLSAKKADQYTFYEFLKNYHQRDSKNELVRKDFSKEVRGVLDGQQRISSMYIALQGIYQTKRKYAKSNSDNSYPERQFFLNLLSTSEDYEFKFLTEEDSQKRSEDTFYFRVRDILKEPKDTDPYDIIERLEEASGVDFSQNQIKYARKKLQLLMKKLNEESLVNYFKIVEKDLDEILDIFVRVNSGGLILSKSDLLFSTLVAHWENGRDQIEKLIEDLNGQDGLFNFNTDFLMRSCLFLIDAPMSFKVHNFDKKNINKIKDNWASIGNALTYAVQILRELGFNKTRLSSNYAITPIAYYIFKGGVVNASVKFEFKKFLVNSLLKQIYSGQADSSLNALREGLRKNVENTDGTKEYQLKNKMFSFNEYKKSKMASGKKLSIDADDVEVFLEHKKGPFCFLLLSTLYPDLKLDQISFHQDHMHPHSLFKWETFNDIGLAQETSIRWLEMRDQLPNLQLLEGIENVTKHATPLIDWVAKNSDDETYYRSRNYIPEEQSLDFKDFDEFFEARKNLMRTKLYEIFEISVSEQDVVLEATQA